MSPQDAPFLPFHEDEIRAQELAGLRAGRAAIRPYMPEQHRDFFALLPYLFTATLDAEGWPVASILAGPAGFIRSPDPQTLRLEALPAADDPASPGFASGLPIGLLGLDLSTRRRNRANGHVAARDGSGLTVAIAQSFGNCPQYIQTRTATPRPRTPAAAEPLAHLDTAARQLIAGSDTLFVASRSRGGVGESGGLDMSHRGGLPGFAALDGDTLTVPDFRGNRFFNTLGNLLGDPRAGLLFVDFASGDVVQLQGTVTIDWPARRWRMAVERGWRRRAALPFDWSFGDYAPQLAAPAT
jgi:predicted pyridoxine 5'-phosphate oxidase superfamily flavin-nucleotide-binding protein